MKIKIWFIAVFLAALLIGYLSVFPFLQGSVIKNNITVPAPEEISAIPAEAGNKLELFDIDRDFFATWQDLGIEMLETGQGVRLEETKARTGEKLLGLFHENGGSFLRYSKVNIKNDEEGWKNISVDHKTKPRFLLRNAGMLKEGKVTTLFSGVSSSDYEVSNGYETTTFEENTVRQFQLDDTEYTFRLQKGLSRSKEKILVLLFEDGKTSQIINFTYYSDSETPYLGDNLLWVGDLDNDDRLDFYLEFYNEKGSYSTGLFLSSKAEKGKLVKMVGGFSTLGC